MLKWLGRIALALMAVIGLVLVVLYEKDLTLEEAKAKLTNDASDFIEIGDLAVHYRREGQGFPIVLVHGTGALLQTWDPWTKALTANKYEVIRMDLPGFGLTGPAADDNYSISMYTQLLDSLVYKLGIDSFHLAGNSLGGRIAWEYALDHPQKLAKLILLDPSGFKAPQSKSALAFRVAQLGPVAYALTKIGTTNMVQKTLTDVYADDSKVTDELVDLYVAASKRPGNRNAFIARLQQENRDRMEELRDLGTRTLLQWGAEDYLIPTALSSEFASRLPNDTLIIYPEVGHVPMEEAPQQTVEDALFFLQQVEQSTDTTAVATPL